jgi:hypothetical protein
LYPAQSTIYIVHFFMAFDFRLSLSIGAASRHLPLGVSSMNDWLNDEVNRIEGEDAITESQNVRKQEIGSQCQLLWRDLHDYLAKDVRRMNDTPQIRRKVGGSEVLFDDANPQILVVHKRVLPSVRLTITKEHLSVSIEREITRNGGTVQSATDPERESDRLHCDLDQDNNACYRTDAGLWLRAKEASGYILSSILRVT